MVDDLNIADMHQRTVDPARIHSLGVVKRPVSSMQDAVGRTYGCGCEMRHRNCAGSVRRLRMHKDEVGNKHALQIAGIKVDSESLISRDLVK